MSNPKMSSSTAGRRRKDKVRMKKPTDNSTNILINHREIRKSSNEWAFIALHGSLEWDSRWLDLENHNQQQNQILLHRISIYNCWIQDRGFMKWPSCHKFTFVISKKKGKKKKHPSTSSCQAWKYQHSSSYNDLKAAANHWQQIHDYLLGWEWNRTIAWNSEAWEPIKFLLDGRFLTGLAWSRLFCFTQINRKVTKKNSKQLWSKKSRFWRKSCITLRA